MSNQLQTQSSGLTPQTMDEVYILAGKISLSQLAPKDYKNKPDDTAIAMLMGLELGLNPMQAIQNIAVINGRPSIWGDALLALVQNHPSFQSIVETFDDNTMTAKCVVTRKGGMPHEQTFSKADSETAGLWGRNTWKQYPKRMLAMRARGFALRNQFADALLGLITAEEAYDLPQLQEVEINPVQTVEEPAAIELPAYPSSDFKNNFPKWEKVILAGKKTHAEIKDIVSTKGVLSEDQIMQIDDIGVTA